MVDELRGDPYAPPEHVAAAEDHVRLFYEGFAKTREDARRAREAAAVQANGGNPATRKTGKQPLPTAPPVAKPTVRLTTKQPAKRVITDYFHVRSKTKSQRTGGEPVVCSATIHTPRV